MAMDYERKIRQLEVELEHQKALLAHQRNHLDAHDRSFEVAGDRLDRTETLLEQTAQSQARTQDMLEKFVTILASSHSNGRSKQKEAEGDGL